MKKPATARAMTTTMIAGVRPRLRELVGTSRDRTGQPGHPAHVRWSLARPGTRLPATTIGS
jgi:hypothetical protein